MIVVFVVDTSPSMSTLATTGPKGISRLDVAKMSVENLARGLDKRVMEHNRRAVLQAASRLEQFDEFLLLSTGLQPDAGGAFGDDHASCGAGGRLLVGAVAEGRCSPGGAADDCCRVVPLPDRSEFEHELKRLTVSPPPSEKAGGKFPDRAGGAGGLNAALSHGLGLLSRYRLARRIVENFGMGRLPWADHQMAKAGADGGAFRHDSPLQPACLILLTDGECLRAPPERGGGPLSLRFGNMPLREFYREPFRWDQRIFIQHVAEATAPPLHKSLRALCEVTGGAHMRINSSASSLSQILTAIAPPRPRRHSIADPLRLPSLPTPTPHDDALDVHAHEPASVFVNGGPVCSFQCLEEGGGPGAPALHRAMILFAGLCEQPRWLLNAETPPPARPCQCPLWCIPESHFPSKKIDALPPRPSQPLLHYSWSFLAVGSPVFDPYAVMKALHRLDQVQKANWQMLVNAGDNPPPIVNRMLQRDVYICEWLEHEASSRSGPNGPSNSSGAPRTIGGREHSHAAVFVRGAGRPGLTSEGADNILNIGILHCPHGRVHLRDVMNAPKTGATDRLPTLTLLPPDAHILIPLLIKVAETEHRILKKATETKDSGSKHGATAGLIKKKISSATAARAVHMDDNWKAEFRAYLFRLPAYYLPAVRRALRPLLPPSSLSLLNYESQHEAISSLCFSPTCLHKIQQGEKAAECSNEWLRSMEQNLRLRKHHPMHDAPLASDHLQTMGRQPAITRQEAQQDASSPTFDHFKVSAYLSSLRNAPPPWKKGETSSKHESDGHPSLLTLLPSSCLLSYYESRRRWIFGGSGLTTQGLYVEGANNDGFNAHHHNTSNNMEDMPLIALADVGAGTLVQTSIARMGDFKERLHSSPSTFVDYGGSSSVPAITTAADGSPNYCVDDDALPLMFFDATTGEFLDSPALRARSKTTIHFGNPFHDKRGDSIIPEKFLSQRRKHCPITPPAYHSESAIEGEGEAVFTGKRPTSPSSLGKSVDSNLLSTKKKRATGPPLRAGDDKHRKTLPTERTEKTAKYPEKDEQHKSFATSSPQPPPPQSRPPPPRRKPSSSPPMQKPPAPPKRHSHVSAHSLSQQAQVHEHHRHTSQKPAMSKPAPPKRQVAAPSKRQVEEAPAPVASANSNSELQQQNITVQLQNPAVQPKINLPEGWLCVWSKSQQRWYFFDKKTNKSVWDPEHIKMH